MITPLDIATYKLFDQVKTYYFQRKVSNILDSHFIRKDEKEKADYIMAMTSLFKKAHLDKEHRFTILLPMGGIVYYFVSEDDD